MLSPLDVPAKWHATCKTQNGEKNQPSIEAKPSEPVLDVEVVVRHAVEEVRARRNARSAKDGPLRLGKAFPVRGALFCGLEK